MAFSRLIGIRLTKNLPTYVRGRAVGRSENPGVPVLFGGHNLLPLVEIGLTDMPKSGGAMAHGTPGTPRDDIFLTFKDNEIIWKWTG